MAQSKTLLEKLWKKHIEPLNKFKGGGAKNLGFYYLDELSGMPPILELRGDTMFILHPGRKFDNGILVPDREDGHWTVITVKSDGIEYFDPLIDINGVPSTVNDYLERLGLPIKINKDSPQSNVSEKSKSFQACGLYSIRFLKNSFK